MEEENNMKRMILKQLSRKLTSVLLACCLLLSTVVLLVANVGDTMAGPVIDPAAFDLEMYIADQYIKKGTRENEIVQRFYSEATMTQLEAKHLQNDGGFNVGYTLWHVKQFATANAEGIRNMLTKKNLYLALLLKGEELE